MMEPNEERLDHAQYGQVVQWVREQNETGLIIAGVGGEDNE